MGSRSPMYIHVKALLTHALPECSPRTRHAASPATLRSWIEIFQKAAVSRRRLTPVFNQAGKYTPTNQQKLIARSTLRRGCPQNTREEVPDGGCYLQTGDGEEPRQVTIVAPVLLAVDHHVIEAGIKLLRNRMGGSYCHFRSEDRQERSLS